MEQPLTNQKMKNIQFESIISFLKNGSLDSVALKNNQKQLTYGELWKLVHAKSRHLECLNGRIVGIYSKDPLSRVIDLLSIIEAGGYVFIIDSENQLRNTPFLNEKLDKELIVYTDQSNCDSLSSYQTITHTPEEESQFIFKINKTKRVGENGGTILKESGKNPEIYIQDIKVVEDHVNFTIKTFQLEDSLNMMASESIQNIDLLEWILPAIGANATLYFHNEKTFSTNLKNNTGIIKIYKNELKNRQLDSIISKCPFDINQLIISSDSKITGFDLKPLEGVYPAIKEILFTYQLPNLSLSIIQGNIRLESVDFNSIESLPYSKPFGKTNVIILDDNLNVTPVNVKGTLLFENKCIQNSLGKKVSFREVNLKGQLNLLREIKYKAKFLTGGYISLLNKTSRELLHTNRTIALDYIEEVLKMNSLIDDAIVVGKHNDDKIVIKAFVIMRSKPKTTSMTTLRKWLKRYIKVENLPNHIQIINEFPKNEDGKIDYKILEEMQVDLSLQKNITPFQLKLIKIWKKVLDVDAVNLDDSFFELGGHSLLALKLVSVIRVELNLELTIKDVFIWSTLSDMTKFLDSAGDSGKVNIKALHIPDGEKVPLSFAQKGLWFIDQFQGSTQYHIPALMKIKGHVNTQVLESAFKEIISRHKALRTVIREENGKAYQVVQILEWKMNYVEVSNEEETEALIKDIIKTPFDLSNDCMLRVLLIKLGESEYTLALTVHHIASDGWSAYLLLDELKELYESKLTNSPSQLKPIEIQYTDYSFWQHENINGEYLKKELKYWEKQLSGIEYLELPTDYPRPAQQSFNGNRKTFIIGTDLREKLSNISQQEGVTMFMTILAAFKLLLYKYTGQKDICVGSPIAGRHHLEIEPLIGYFANTIVLRTDFAQSETFSSLVNQIKEVTLNAYLHQDVPFEKIVDTLGIERDMSRTPIFQVMFSMESVPDLSEIKMGDLILSNIPIDQKTTQFDWNFYMEDNGDSGMEFHIEYDTDLFKTETIERLGKHFINLLQTVVLNPDETISNLSLMTEQEESQLILGFNDNRVDFSFDLTCDQLIEKMAIEYPDKIAISDRNKNITYKELNSNAGRQANLLKNVIEINEEAIIAVLSDRSVAMIESIYAIWKAGGVYLPIHPELPENRLGIILNDANVDTLIFTKKYDKLAIKLLQDIHSLKNIVCIDANIDNSLTIRKEVNIYGLSQIESQVELLHSKSKIDGLAYIIYTSGSTGKPKGAMLEHRGMLNHLFIMLKDLNITMDSNVAQNASQSFDISIWQMFVALIIGGKTIVYSSWETLQVHKFIQQINKDHISIFQVVPSYLSVLLDEIEEIKNDLFKQLKFLLVTGETVKKNLLVRWFNKFPNIKVVNAYGPTEAADDITLYILDKTPKYSSIPIGKSLANLNIYIVNEDSQTCPIGVKGEIWVSGIGVGRGYLNDELKTEKVFITDPFQGENNIRLYKTGDIGRFLPNGDIEFYGRKDYQVKVRGYRIELEEIEQHLSQIDEVKESIVIILKGEDQITQIYGYVTCYKKEVDTEELRQKLALSLPEYMVPSQIVLLEKFPLTPNGKVDRKLLSIPEANKVESSNNIIKPGNHIEEVLAEIWKELLELSDISITQNFFKLGGHSLKVVSMVSQIHKKLGAEITIKDVFIYPTIKSLSEIIDDTNKIVFESIPLTDEKNYYPVSNAQRRLWILDCFVDNLSAYNAYSAFHMKGALNAEVLSEAIMSIVNRHEVLRTTFIEREGKPMQVVNNKIKKSEICEIIDYSDSSGTYNSVIDELSTLANLPYDLSKGPLFRSRIYILEDGSYVFFCCMHHIICDGWSNNILVKEILENYKTFEKQQISRLPLLEIQYKDYAAWHLKQIHSETFETHKNYWHKKLGGDIPVLNLPSYTERPPVQTFSGKTISHLFSKATLDGLKSLGDRGDASLFMVLTTLLNVLFYKHTGQNDIILGTVTAGRTHPDLENQIGYYLNTLALRNNIDPENSFMELLENIRGNTLEAFNHQDYPFDLLVNELDFERDISRNPIFDVMILLQSFDEDEDGLLIDGLSNLDISPISIENGGSPFDMDFDFTEEKEELKLLLTFNDSIYEYSQMKNMILHLESLISSVLIEPNEKTGEISIISSAEKELLAKLNDTEKQLPLNLTYHHYLEKYASETPNKPAAIFQNKTISYKNLNNQVNQLARGILKQIELKADDLIAVFLDRSDIMMSVILSIWKTGAAYIPIEKNVPDNRVLSIIADAGIKSIIVDKNLMSEDLKNKISSLCKVIFIQDLLMLITSESIENLNILIDPNSLSFTIFTSGSTGKPKGAMNEHIGMMNHALATADYLQMDQNTVLVQNASQSFDISVWQFFTALVAGGTTVIYGNEIVNSPDQLLKNLILHKVTVFQVVPSYLSMLLEIIDIEVDNTYLLNIKNLICCGEAIKPKSIAHWLTLFPQTKIVNDYGPAEASDGTTWFVFDSVEASATSIPIGKPIYNMSNYIVDGNMNLCPVGVVGEIWVAGIGVGRGYINDEERTKKAFITDPFNINKKQRLYKTGDLGRVLPNGLIEFRGRKDYQIKVNGQRIELGEIEAKLLQLDEVKDAVVIDKINLSNGRKYLFAFIVNKPNTETNILKVKNELSKELPPFMIPVGFQVLDILPLTPNGKVDRKHLSKIAMNEENEELMFIAPKTEIEIILADAWKSVLKREVIGITDNFYETGGDSIGAIQVSSYLYKNELQVEVKDIMRFVTIKELAPLVKPLKRIAEQGIISGQVDLTPIQTAFFEMDKIEPNHYNQSILLKSKGRVNYQALFSSLEYLQGWHDALRITFKLVEGKIIQYMHKDIIPVSLSQYDFRVELKPKQLDEKANMLQAGISLEEGPLMHSALLKKQDADYVLITIHHLVVDAVSWRIIIEDLSTIYQQMINGNRIELPAKTDSFKDWSMTLKAFTQSNKFNDEIMYWKTRCSEIIQMIPYDFNKNQSVTGLVKNKNSLTTRLEKKYVKLLNTRVHKAFNTEINDILLTALGLSVNKCFSLDQVPIMLESHGRVKLQEDLNVNRTIGWFTSEYPVNLNLSVRSDKATLIKVIKDHLHKVPNNGVGYGLIKYLNQTGCASIVQSIIPQIAFNYLGNVDDETTEEQFQIQENTLGNEEALKNLSDYYIEFLGLTKNGYMEFTIEYNTTQFKEQTIIDWLKAFKESLEELIDFCSNRSFSESTPSDFDYSDLSIEDLVELNNLF